MCQCLGTSVRVWGNVSVGGIMWLYKIGFTHPNIKLYVTYCQSKHSKIK